MGYVKGIQWNDELITKEIIKIKEYLEIECMPSYSQIRKVRQSNDLCVAIARRGGIVKWSEKLKLEVIKNETGIGKRGEEIAIELLKNKGYLVKNVSEKNFPYDLLVNDNIKIDVKLSKMHKNSNGNYYTCNLNKRNPTCDIYIIICEKDNLDIDKILIIPSVYLHKTQLSIGEYKSRYNKYKDRWDFIEIYDKFYKYLKKGFK